jgi:FdhD protein
MAATLEESKSVSSEVSIDRWAQGTTTHTTDQVAEEVPIALVYHNVPHVVMLATPANFEDFGVGFTLSEGLVARPDEIREVEVTQGADAVDVRITVAWERFTELLHRRRNLTGRTGCGLCGAEKAEDAIRDLPPVGPGTTVTTQDLHAAIEQMGSLQPRGSSSSARTSAATTRSTRPLARWCARRPIWPRATCW